MQTPVRREAADWDAMGMGPCFAGSVNARCTARHNLSDPMPGMNGIKALNVGG